MTQELDTVTDYSPPKRTTHDFERTTERSGKATLRVIPNGLVSQYYLIYSWKRVQKASTTQYPSENDCFPGDAVEDAEETDTPLSSVSIAG